MGGASTVMVANFINMEAHLRRIGEGSHMGGASGEAPHSSTEGRQPRGTSQKEPLGRRISIVCGQPRGTSQEEPLGRRLSIC